MVKKYTYKQQGDGRDSWICEEIENGELVNRYMVYEDPNALPVIDIDALSDEQILKLKQRFDALK